MQGETHRPTGSSADSADGTYNRISSGIFFSPVLQSRDIVVQLPPEVTPALAGLPAAVATFTGRHDDLQSVLDFLAPVAVGEESPDRESGATAIGVSVSGLPGVGKTELAVQAAQAALTQGWFPGGVLFADLAGYDLSRRRKTREVLRGWLHALGIPDDRVPSDVQDQASLYRTLLKTYADQGRRILIIVDNAADHDDVRPLLPADGRTGLIITSRHTLAMLPTRLIDLGVLSSQSSVELLESLLRRAHPGDTRVHDQRDDARKLARLCGHLPLALQIVGALLAENPSRLLVTMIADLADATTRLEEMRYADTEVSAAFELSYRNLDPDQAFLFRLLPLNQGPEISTEAVTAMAGLGPATTRRRLEALARAHLIEQGSTYGRWRMHDLLRLFAAEVGTRHTDTDNRPNVFAALLDYYLIKTKAAVEHLDPTTNPAKTDGSSEQRMALAWLDTEFPNLTAAVHAATAMPTTLAMARDLPLALHSFLHWRRRFGDAVLLASVAVESARQLGDEEGEAKALDHLGNALQNEPQLEEALEVQQQCLRIRQDLRDEHGVAYALNCIGVTLQKIGRIEGAISAHRDSLSRYRTLGHRRGEGFSLEYLGDVHRKQQHFDKSIAFYREALAIYKETEDLHRQGDMLNSLGSVLREAGDAEVAISTYDLYLNLCRNLRDLHGEAMALGNLGAALRDAGRFDEAVEAHTNSLLAFEETDDRYGRAMELHNLGRTMKEAGRTDEAIKAHVDAARAFSDSGDQHGVACALDHLASIYDNSNELVDAVSARHQYVWVCRELSDRGREAHGLEALGIALRKARHFDEAIAVHLDAITVFQELAISNCIGHGWDNLGVTLRVAERYDDAISAHEKALQTFRDTGDRSDEAEALRYLATALREKQRTAESIAAYREAASIFQELGDLHDEGHVRSDLASMLVESVNLDAATSSYRNAADIFRRSGHHACEAETLAHLGEALQADGRNTEAIAVFYDVTQIFQVIGDKLRRGHALSVLGDLLLDTGELSEAAGNYEEAIQIFREFGDTECEARSREHLETIRHHPQQ